MEKMAYYIIYEDTTLWRIKDAWCDGRRSTSKSCNPLCIYIIYYMKHNRTAYNQYRTIQYVAHYIEVTIAPTSL